VATSAARTSNARTSSAPKKSAPKKVAPASRPRRPRPQLDPELIVDAALRLAARDRTSQVSIRSLGAELGADPTAVYRHFEDKDALARAVIDRLLGEVNAAIVGYTTWRSRLRGSAERLLDVMLAYPAFGSQVGTLTTGGDQELAAVESILSDFKDAGLGDSDAIRFYGMYSSFVLSFASTQAAYLLVHEAELSAAPTWVADYSNVDRRKFPTVAAMHAKLSQIRDRDAYVGGIDIILDAAEALVARPN
jgi:AcrR family transcriptional regulator